MKIKAIITLAAISFCQLACVSTSRYKKAQDSIEKLRLQNQLLSKNDSLQKNEDLNLKEISKQLDKTERVLAQIYLQYSNNTPRKLLSGDTMNLNAAVAEENLLLALDKERLEKEIDSLMRLMATPTTADNPTNISTNKKSTTELQKTLEYQNKYIGTLQSKYNKEVEKNSQLSKTLNGFTLKLEIMDNERIKQVSELTQLIKAYKKNIDSLNTIVAQQNSSLVKYANIEAEQKKKVSERDLADLNTLKDKLNRESELTKKLQTELSELNNTLKDKNSKINQLEEKANSNSKLVSDNQKIKSENTQLKNQISKLELDQTNIVNENNKLKSQQKLNDNSTYKELRANLENATSEILDYKNKIELLNIENSKFKSQISTTNKEIEDLNSKISELNKNAENQANQILELSKLASQSNSSIKHQSLSDSLVAKNQKIQELNAQILALKDKSVQEKINNTRLIENLNDTTQLLRQRIFQQFKEISELKEKINQIISKEQDYANKPGVKTRNNVDSIRNTLPPTKPAKSSSVPIENNKVKSSEITGQTEVFKKFQNLILNLKCPGASVNIENQNILVHLPQQYMFFEESSALSTQGADLINKLSSLLRNTKYKSLDLIAFSKIQTSEHDELVNRRTLTIGKLLNAYGIPPTKLNYGLRLHNETIDQKEFSEGIELLLNIDYLQ